MGKFKKTGRSNYTFKFNCDSKQVDDLIQNFLINNNFKPTTKHGDNYYLSKGMISLDGFKYYINGNIVQIQAFEVARFEDIPLEQSVSTIYSGYAGIAIEKYKKKLKPLFAQLENLGNQNYNNPSSNSSIQENNKGNNNQDNEIKSTNERNSSMNQDQNFNNGMNGGNPNNQNYNNGMNGGNPNNQNYNNGMNGGNPNNQNFNNGMNGGNPNNQNFNNGMNGGNPNNQNFNNGMNGGNPNNQNFNNGMNGGYPNNQNFNNGMYPNGQYASQNNNNETMCIVGFAISVIGLLLAVFGFVIGIPIIMLDFYFASSGMNTNKKGLAIATIVMSSISLFILIINIFLSFI